MNPLSISPMFADLPHDVLDNVLKFSRRRQCVRGEFFFNQGEPARRAIVIVEGRIRLVQHTAEGKDVTMATFAPGDAIGLVMVVINGSFPGSAEVIDNGVALEIPSEILLNLIQHHPGFAVKMINLLAERLKEAQQRITELSVARVQQRIARAITRLASKVGVLEDGAIRLDVRLSRQDVAQLTGTTFETVSRTLTAWERDGLIDARREQIVVLNPHAFMLLAEDLSVDQEEVNLISIKEWFEKVGYIRAK